MKLSELKENYAHLKSDRGWDLVIKFLYHIRLLKYVPFKSFLDIDPNYTRIASKEKIKGFVEAKLLTESKGVYRATSECKKLLLDIGHNNLLLPELPTGNGSINELSNTNVFIQALKLPDFKTLLYPSFGYIIPDALLVRERDGKYKLDFLEVEKPKVKWQEYCQNKAISYDKLSHDIKAYNYWIKRCSLLGLREPTIEQFKFGVIFVGGIKLDYENFTFTDKLE